MALRVMACVSICLHLIALAVLLSARPDNLISPPVSTALDVTLPGQVRQVTPAKTSLPEQPSMPQQAAARINLAADLTAVADPYWLTTNLQRSPRPVTPIEPEYPIEAGGVQGTVVLRLRISEQGQVDEVTVVRAEPAGFFEKAAINAFSAARFIPGERLGEPVKSQLLIEVAFATFNKGAIDGSLR